MTSGNVRLVSVLLHLLFIVTILGMSLLQYLNEHSDAKWHGKYENECKIQNQGNYLQTSK